jgi:hypothetical protein
MTVVSAHQPNYLPWIGFFQKILKSDIFVILDHVEFSRRGFINRNRIKGPKGAVWLTVPVISELHTPIFEVKIDNKQKWKRKHYNSIRLFYGKAPYFDEIFPYLSDVYEKEWDNMFELNLEIIKIIVEMLDIQTEFKKSSELNPKGKKMEMIIDICKKVGADIYYSGRGAKKYQDEDVFQKNGIKLVYQNFEHPVYPQRFGEFVPYLSIVDMLFNVGPDKTKEILENL